MLHKMNLQNSPFRSIKAKTKTIEMRLYDEKRQLINIGDEIEFSNRETNEKIFVKVTNIYKFKNFKELYSQFDKISLGYRETEIAKPEDMELYYSKSDIDNYGVVGIEIELN